MPIPAPHKGENHTDFMGRCMGDQTMMTDYDNNKQRLAVCFNSWRDKHGSAGIGKPPKKSIDPNAGESEQDFMARCEADPSLADMDPEDRQMACQMDWWRSDAGGAMGPGMMAGRGKGGVKLIGTEEEKTIERAGKVPEPKKGESKEDYMRRCQEAGHKEQQCLTLWNDVAAGHGPGWHHKGMRLNGAAESKARSLINAGKYDNSASWSLDAAEGDALLGSAGNDWSNYAAWHLAEDTAAAPRTKARYRYPYGKGGQVYGAALRAIRSRAAQQNATAIFDAAGQLLDALKAKESAKKAVGMNRAYAVMETRGLNEGRRELEGIATTPSTDHLGDIIESTGAAFALPIPLLWQHQADMPVGYVEFAEPNAKGIPFRARIVQIDEPGELKNLTDKAWQAVKAKLVRGVSIGFSPKPGGYEPIKGGGIRFKAWNWHELSLVTVPANADATISVIRSIDTAYQLAASGDKAGRETSNSAGVTARSNIQQQVNKMAKQTIEEQIRAFEATRAAKDARMQALMDDASDRGETLTADETEEYDTLGEELKAIDGHLVRLNDRQKVVVRTARMVDGDDERGGSASRGGDRNMRAAVTARGPELPKGTAFTRFVIAMARSKGNLAVAADMAKQWHDTTPQVEDVMRAAMHLGGTNMLSRAAVNPGDTVSATYALPLVNYQIMAAEFIELLRPSTIIGRIGGFRRVPFNVKMPSQTSGSTVNWVGEGKIKPVSGLGFDTVTLPFSKVAGIVVLTEELIRFSNPSVEGIVRTDLTNAIAQFMDRDFIDPTKAVATGVSPASITNGVSPVVATGTDGTALRADVKTVMASFLSNNLSPAGSVWIMSQQQALAISLMVNALGQPEFPGISMDGGTFLGIPVVASENIPGTGGSPTDGSLIILAKPSEILLADDGGVTIDVSREASIQMDSTPDSPPTASTVAVSLWQNNLVALRAEREVHWVKRNSNAVQMISYAKYA